VITNLGKLSKALEKATLPRAADLVAAIKADRAAIERQIKSDGFSIVRVDGRQFKVLDASSTNGTKAE
jgi:hypothetical protein